MNQYKKANVVLLSHKDGVIYKFKNFLSDIINSWYKITYGEGIPYHLYITSDDEIKEGNWIYNELSGVGKYVKNEEFNDGIVVIYNKQGFEVAEDIKNVKKIIATTDTSLTIPDTINFNKFHYLPQPSQQFITKYIEEYNKGIVIEDILVEYEEDVCIRCKGTGTEIVAILGECYCLNCKGEGLLSNNLHLKINPKDNTITIKRVNSWNKNEEVIILIRWDKENL